MRSSRLYQYAMQQQQRLNQIHSRVAWLRDHDGACTVFGSNAHEYQSHAVLSEAQLAAFEATHGVTLPPSYRAFLAEVGNGGVGPYYGLAPLTPVERDRLPQHRVVVQDAIDTPRQALTAVPSLARPFVLTQPWSPTDGASPLPPGTSPYDGCVFLADQGCAYFDVLVVNGPRAGEVWTDDTAADGPLRKVSDDFLDWYEDWIERAQLEWLEKNAADMARYAPPHYPGIEECVAQLDAALTRAPDWAAGWRTRGYVALNREQFDAALSAFSTAATHGKSEPQPRLHLDRARVERLRRDCDAALVEIAAGLSQPDVWSATKTELHEERVLALDSLGRSDEALQSLEALATDAVFRLDHHFEAVRRRLARADDRQAWALLDDAVARNVGPDRNSQPATPAVIYEACAQWLADHGADDLAARVQSVRTLN